MLAHVPRLPFSLDPLIAEARRRTRRRRLAITLVLLAAGGVGATFALRSNVSPPARGDAAATGALAPANCGSGVAGPGFRAFACMSGGAGTGHPHPKELLVVRTDGSAVAYPAFRVGEFAVGAGEVVATYDVSLVRVTRSRLVPLVTAGELASTLHVRSAAIADVHGPALDAGGDVSFVASTSSRSGCRNHALERMAGGTIRQIRASPASRNHTCA